MKRAFWKKTLSGVLLLLTCRTTEAQAVLTLKFDQVMDNVIGMGGNYCFAAEHPTTRYTLDNLKPTIARTEMTLTGWEPENDNDDPHSVNWEYFRLRDTKGSNLRLEFEIMRELTRENIPFACATWHLADWVPAKDIIEIRSWDNREIPACDLYRKG